MKNFTKKQWLALALVFVLLLTGLGLHFFRGYVRVQRLRRMRDEAFSPAALQASPEERRAKADAFRKEQEKLSPAERREVWADLRKEREKELERYHNMSKAEKTAFLDDRIDQMDAMRATWQSSNGGNGPGRGPGLGNERRAGERSGPGNEPTTQAGPSPENRGANLSAEDRERRRKDMLDATTPEQRALRDQFFKDLQARRVQRGLPNSPRFP
jgi:hypothetical protein